MSTSTQWRMFGVIFFSMAGLLGCDLNDMSSPDVEDDSETYEDDYEDMGPFVGWGELYEPLGDESFIYYRVTPENYAAGDQVTFEVAVGSLYGPNDDADISYRCTVGNETDEYGLVEVETGGAWAQLEREGMFQADWEAGTSTRLPGMTAPREEISYGYMLHTAQILIPEGREVIEMRVQEPEVRYNTMRIPETDFAFPAFPTAW